MPEPPSSLPKAFRIWVILMGMIVMKTVMMMMMMAMKTVMMRVMKIINIAIIVYRRVDVRIVESVLHDHHANNSRVGGSKGKQNSFKRSFEECVREKRLQDYPNIWVETTRQ